MQTPVQVIYVLDTTVMLEPVLASVELSPEVDAILVDVLDSLDVFEMDNTATRADEDDWTRQDALLTEYMEKLKLKMD